MRRALLCLLLGAGCGSENPVSDAGPMDAAGSDSSVTSCAADTECEDGNFCSVFRCLPGDPTADARGCVAAGSPCRVGEMCDGVTDACVPEVCGPEMDRDGDGHDSLACGGNDCDDDDDQRYGGNAEICDGVHDEDCDDTTLASDDDGDGDGDGFISGTCCNGAVCGEDCDDTDRQIFPGAREICNGRDDDCDGLMDEIGDVPLCPGGVCVAGRCDLAGWDRTFGGTEFDQADSVAMDDLGNVYITASAVGPANFGAGLDAGLGDSDAIVVAFGPDGVYRWHRRFGSAGFDAARAVTVDRRSGEVYVVGAFTEDTDLGGGLRTGPSTFVVALDTDGMYRWDRLFPPLQFPSVEVYESSVAVGGWLFAPYDLGGGERPLGGADAAGFLAVYDRLGSHVWDRILGGGTGTSTFANVASYDARGVLAMGAFQDGSVDFGNGSRTPVGRRDLFVAAYASDGRPEWDYTAGGTDTVDLNDAVRLTRGEIVIGGNIAGMVDFGGGPIDAGMNSSFLLQLSASGGYGTHHTWGTGAGDSVASVAATSSGDVIAVGRFTGTVDLGGGGRTANASTDLFIATYTSSLVHRRDLAFGATGTNEATGVAVGPADSTAVVGRFFERIDLGSGMRTAAGGSDGFVVRLAN